ncbi:helix-turn-helix domain-containing protein [Cesiribacter sp. SM1]|uniref:helix-turn-helix domain-containing protein n=1 Tax=Cesiribacter sp. SM1 TaxID=2861196 RepID=UPI001CD5B660|nr:helix-turn-helix domain-containing protein [Cesiribacter sp. SM1]
MKTLTDTTVHEHKSTSDFPFHIYTLQYFTQKLGNQHTAPRKMGDFEIVWFSSGAGRKYIDLKEYPIGNNTLFCVAPGQIRQLIASPNSRGFVVSFKESFLTEGDDGFGNIENNSLFEQFIHCPIIQPENDMCVEIEDLLKKITKEYNNYDMLRSEMLRRYLKILLIHIKRISSPTEAGSIQNRQISLVQKFTSLLEKHYREKKMVADYAELLCVSPNYLNELVKKTYGHSAGHYIRQRIVLEAKKQAKYSGANMKEIAYDLGFEDLGHFSKFFKNISGMNFTEYKKNIIHQFAPHHV